MRPPHTRQTRAIERTWQGGGEGRRSGRPETVRDGPPRLAPPTQCGLRPLRAGSAHSVQSPNRHRGRGRRTTATVVVRGPRTTSTAPKTGRTTAAASRAGFSSGCGSAPGRLSESDLEDLLLVAVEEAELVDHGLHRVLEVWANPLKHAHVVEL